MSQLVVNTVSSTNPLTVPLALEGNGVTFNGGGLPIGSLPLASQLQAQTGTDNTVLMTPLRTAEAIAAQVPTIVANPLLYKGNWDGSTNTPALSNGTGTTGWVYRVSVAGTQDFGAGPITFALNDRVAYNGTVWEKWDITDEVTSVHGRTGDVVALAGDYAAFYDKFPVGARLEHMGRTAPTGFYVQDGSSKSRVTDSALFEVLCPDLGAPTFTIGSPEVVNLVGHTLQIDEPFFFETTGTLPTGITDNTVYYVISAGYTANSFQFSTTPGGAAVNTSGSDSGTHKLRACPYGIPSSTHFYLPDERGLSSVGAGTHSVMTRANGSFYDGGFVGATRNDQIQGHVHASDGFNIGGGPGNNPYPAYNGGAGQLQVQNTLSSTYLSDGYGTPRIGNETRPAQRAVLVCIKY